MTDTDISRLIGLARRVLQDVEEALQSKENALAEQVKTCSCCNSGRFADEDVDEIDEDTEEVWDYLASGTAGTGELKRWLSDQMNNIKGHATQHEHIQTTGNTQGQYGR